MTKQVLNALWTKIKSVFATKEEVADLGVIGKIQEQLTIHLGSIQSDGTYVNPSLATTTDNEAWTNVVAPALFAKMWSASSNVSNYVFHVSDETVVSNVLADCAPVDSHTLRVRFTANFVDYEVLFNIGTKNAVVSASKSSDLMAAKNLYVSGISVSELLASPLADSTLVKLRAMRMDDKTYNTLILFSAGDTYTPATIKKHGSMFESFFYYDDKYITLTADSTNNNWSVSTKTLYVKPSDGIPPTDMSSSVRDTLSAAVLHTPQALTSSQQAQARENIGAGEDDVFVAEYGVTTYADISAAYDDGKAVFVKDGDYRIPLTNKAANGIFYFGGVSSSNYVWWCYVNPSSGWVHTGYYIEDRSNKKATITGNESSTTYYPTTKAVVDYVDGIVGNVENLLAAI